MAMSSKDATLHLKSATKSPIITSNSRCHRVTNILRNVKRLLISKKAHSHSNCINYLKEINSLPNLSDKYEEIVWRIRALLRYIMTNRTEFNMSIRDETVKMFYLQSTEENDTYINHLHLRSTQQWSVDHIHKSLIAHLKGFFRLDQNTLHSFKKSLDISEISNFQNAETFQSHEDTQYLFSKTKGLLYYILYTRRKFSDMLVKNLVIMYEFSEKHDRKLDELYLSSDQEYSTKSIHKDAHNGKISEYINNECIGDHVQKDNNDQVLEDINEGTLDIPLELLTGYSGVDDGGCGSAAIAVTDFVDYKDEIAENERENHEMSKDIFNETINVQQNLSNIEIELFAQTPMELDTYNEPPYTVIYVEQFEKDDEQEKDNLVPKIERIMSFEEVSEMMVEANVKARNILEYLEGAFDQFSLDTIEISKSKDDDNS